MRAPARKRVGSIQPPVPQPRACISSERASKNCLAQRSSGRCGCDLEAGTAVNMRGRLYGLVACLIYFAPNVAAEVASAANTPLTDEPGGQRTPRRARGFPMWTFLAINPPAGRNSPYRLVGVQGFGEKRAFQRMTGRFCLVGVRAQFKNGYGYWAQLPTRLPGEHSGWGKLAERVGLPCPIA